MQLRRFPAVFIGMTALALFLSACGSQPRGGKKNITIKGSDTLVILGQRWAETYMNENKDAIVQVTGGGSGTGIAALINKSTDICAASRPMKEEERKQAEEKHGKKVVEIPVALDGIAIYVHEDNPLKEILLSQVKDIYTGKTKTWKGFGWEDKKIIVYSRENNSGTYVYFKEHVLEEEDFAGDVLTLPGTAAVINAVSKDKYSMGYGGIAYAKGVKVVGVKKDAKEKAVSPSLETVRENTYPVSRSLYFYVMGEPEGALKSFIDWVLGDEGQKICEEVGYYPLR